MQMQVIGASLAAGHLLTAELDRSRFELLDDGNRRGVAVEGPLGDGGSTTGSARCRRGGLTDACPSAQPERPDREAARGRRVDHPGAAAGGSDAALSLRRSRPGAPLILWPGK
jgi:hypothetical protein